VGYANRVGKYLTVFKIGLADRFAYRANFFLGTLMRLVPFVTVVFFWNAAMENAVEGAFGHYSSRTIVGYFILIFLARAFSSMPGLSRAISEDVREGGLNKFLVRPIDYPLYQLLLRAAHKGVYLVTMGIPFGLFVFLMSDYFPGFPDPLRLAVGVAALVLAFVIGFHLTLLLGMLSFWFLEVTTFLFVIELIEFFLSGHMIPLDLLPSAIVVWIDRLPFAYMAYFPAAVLLGGIPDDELVPRLLVGVGWATAIWFACRMVYRAGLRRYSAYGG